MLGRKRGTKIRLIKGKRDEMSGRGERGGRGGKKRIKRGERERRYGLKKSCLFPVTLP